MASDSRGKLTVLCECNTPFEPLPGLLSMMNTSVGCLNFCYNFFFFIIINTISFWELIHCQGQTRSVHFLHPLHPNQGCRGAVAYPSCHRARRGVHPTVSWNHQLTFWTVRGSWSTWKEPPHEWRQHANSAKKEPNWDSYLSTRRLSAINGLLNQAPQRNTMLAPFSVW